MSFPPQSAAGMASGDRPQIDFRFELVVAGLAEPHVAAAALVRIFGPFRRRQQMAALGAGKGGAGDDGLSWPRCMARHDNSSQKHLSLQPPLYPRHDKRATVKWPKDGGHALKRPEEIAANCPGAGAARVTASGARADRAAPQERL